MAYIERIRLVATTAADGSATVFSDHILTGEVLEINYVKDATNELANGTTATFSCETSGLVVDTETINTGGSFSHAPRMPTHNLIGAALLYAAAGTPVSDRVPIAGERLKLVIAGGGNTKTGTFDVYVG